MTQLRIRIWDDAKDFLDALTKKRRLQIVKKIVTFAKDEKNISSKVLVGFEPFRRIRCGDYRIVYFVESETLNIVFIDNRNDDKIYRKLMRRMR